MTFEAHLAAADSMASAAQDHGFTNFESDSVWKAGYNLDTSELAIEWLHSDHAYVYSDVPESVYHALIGADSVGRIAAMAKARYGPCARVEDGIVLITEEEDEEKSNVVTVGTVISHNTDDVAYLLTEDGIKRVGKNWHAFNGEVNWLEWAQRVVDDGYYSIVDPEPENEKASPDFGFAVVENGTVSRYGVKYTITVVNGNELAHPSGPFEPVFDAADERDALVRFNAAISEMERITGWSGLKVKVLAVTHYFD